MCKVPEWSFSACFPLESKAGKGQQKKHPANSSCKLFAGCFFRWNRLKIILRVQAHEGQYVQLEKRVLKKPVSSVLLAPTIKNFFQPGVQVP